MIMREKKKQNRRVFHVASEKQHEGNEERIVRFVQCIKPSMCILVFPVTHQHSVMESYKIFSSDFVPRYAGSGPVQMAGGS